MDAKIFNVLQDYISISVRTAIITHPKNFYERGFKYQYDLWLITSGRISFNYDGSHYFLSEGDIFLMYPNVIYDAQILSENATFIYSHFTFNLGNSPSVLDHFPMEGYIPVEQYCNAKLKSTVDTFKHFFDNKMADTFMSNFICKQYFSILISTLFEYKMSHFDMKLKSAKPFAKLNRLLPVIDYMHQYYNQTISVKHLAFLCSMSEKYFITYFKQVFGITPLQYHIEIRMQKAVTLISDRLYTIKEIADMLGYKDQYNFSTAFKKHYGVPPSKYLSDGEYTINI